MILIDIEISFLVTYFKMPLTTFIIELNQWDLVVLLTLIQREELKMELVQQDLL